MCRDAKERKILLVKFIDELVRDLPYLEIETGEAWKTWGWRLGREVYLIREVEAAIGDRGRVYVMARGSQLTPGIPAVSQTSWRVTWDPITGYAFSSAEGEFMDYAEWARWIHALVAVRRLQKTAS